MRALISALAVAGLVAIALPGYADDVKTNPKPLNAPGRAIDEGGAVTTNPKPLKLARPCGGRHRQDRPGESGQDARPCGG